MRISNSVILVWAIVFHLLAVGAGAQTATFLGQDRATQGNWKASYGKDGHRIEYDSTSQPSYGSVELAGQSKYLWALNTTDVRALEKADGTGRVAGTWYNGGSTTSFELNVTLSDANPHRVSIYCFDYESNARSQIVEVRDPGTNALLDSRAISHFNGGVYLRWNVSGNVRIKVINTGTSNAVVSGVFFDPTEDPVRTAHDNFHEVPQFRTEPLPPEYQGKSVKELTEISVNETVIPASAHTEPGFRWTPTIRLWTDQALVLNEPSDTVLVSGVVNGTVRIRNDGTVSLSVQMQTSNDGNTWTNYQATVAVAASSQRDVPIANPPAAWLRLVAKSASAKASASILRSYSNSAPEFRPHTELNQFVLDMESDPMALAAFVQNEVALVDAIRSTERSADVSGPQPSPPTAITAAAMRRNAYTTYIDRQGSPYEQCNLLVYLLREAGYAAALVDPAGTKTRMLSKRLSNMLHLQMSGFITEEDDELFEVRYPWVVFHDTSDPGQPVWRHLFPWIKDTVVEEGFDLYSFLPDQYNTGRKWLEAYLKNDENINEFLGDDGNDTPSTMFNRFVEKHVATYGLSLEDLGVRIYDRKSIYSSWHDFPAPFLVQVAEGGGPDLTLRSDWRSIPELYTYLKITVTDNGGKELATTNRRNIPAGDPAHLAWQYAMDLNGRSISSHITPLISEDDRLRGSFFLVFGAFDKNHGKSETTLPGHVYGSVGFPDGASHAGELLFMRNFKSGYKDYYLSGYPRMWPSIFNDEPSDVAERRDLSSRTYKIEWVDSSNNPIVAPSELKADSLDVVGINLKIGGVTSRGLDLLRSRTDRLTDRWQKIGAITHLVGQAYFERVDRLGGTLQRMHKCHADVYGLGVTVLKSASGTIEAPRIDMPMEAFPYWNNSLRPDLQAARADVLRDFTKILAAELSAQEHSVINDFYHQKDAISTVKLLRIANRTREIVRAGETLGPEGDESLEFPDGFYEMSSSEFITRYDAAESATADATPTTNAGVITDLKGVFSRFVRKPDNNLGWTGTTPNRIPLSNRPAFSQKWAGAPTNADFIAAFGSQSAANSNNVYKNFTTGSSWAKLKTWCDNNPEGKLYITPGPVKSEDSPTKPSYVGWGSLMISDIENFAAWIEGNQAAYNGGFGVGFSTSYSTAFNPTNFGSLSISSFGTNYFLSSPNIRSFNSINPTWSGMSAWSSAYNLSPLSSFSSASFQGAYSSGFGSQSTGWAGIYNQGYFGDSQFHRSWSSSSNFVEDPVNIVNGEFYTDEVDLTLPGPLPLELRRNYSSQSEANTILGPGWKLSLMPYLSVAGKNPGDEGYDAVEHAGKPKGYLIYAADWDGSVLAFRDQSPTGGGPWRIDSNDNRGLKNFSGQDVDELNNPFNEMIVKNGTVYTWFRADGSKAIYNVRSFPVKVVEGSAPADTKVYTREMPYLSSIQDPEGNSLDFTFYTVSNAAAGVAVELSKAETGYGQLKKVRSSNGNFLVFSYDSQQRISDVYSNDGRRVQYRYDPLGDLVEVELPDGAVYAYGYQHELAPRPDSKVESSVSGRDWVYTCEANAGARIKGWFQPQASGAYKFQLVGTGYKRLLVSSGDSDAPEFLSPALGAAGTSGVYNLTAGHSYYIETRQTSGPLTLKWQRQLPDDTWTAMAVIQKADLRPYKPEESSENLEKKIMVEVYRSLAPVTLAAMEELPRFKGVPYSRNLLTKITDPEGRSTINEYDTAFKPDHPVFGDYKYRRVVKQSSTSGEDMVPIPIAEFQYNPAGNPWLSTPEDYEVSLMIDKTRPAEGDQITTYIHKDGCLRYVAQPLAVGFSPGNTNIDYVASYEWEEVESGERMLRRTVENRDLRGLRTTFSYGADGLLSSTVSQGNLTGEGGADSAETTYFYNADRRLIKRIMPSPGGNRKTEVNYIYYPAMDGVTRQPNAATPRTDDYLYRHKPEKVAKFAVVAPSRVSNAEPNAADKVSETRYVYVENDNGPTAFARGLIGEVRRSQFAGGAAEPVEGWDLTYDARGFPTGKTSHTYSTDPAVFESYVHDARGLMIRNTGPAGRATKLGYDPRGRPISTEYYADTGLAAQALSWDYTYFNQMGEVIWKDGPRYDPEDYQFFDYDGAGRKIVEVIWKSRAKADRSGVEADGYSILNHYYDGFGNRVKSVDPRGNYVVMAYDAMGRMTSSLSYDENSILLSNESFTYEPGSEVATHTNPLGGTTVTSYTSTGKPKSISRPDGTTESWTYYLDDRVRTHTLANQAVWTFTYDDLLLKETRVLELGGTLLSKAIVTSDIRGNVVREETFTDAVTSFVTTREYDGLGRLVRETGPPALATEGTTVSEQQETLYAYSFDQGAHVDQVTVTEGGGARVLISRTDNLGRDAYTAVKDGTGQILESTTRTYDTKHHFVRTFRGSNAQVDSEELVFSDTTGKPVLTKIKDSSGGGEWKYRLTQYDVAGNAISSTDEENKTTSNEFDGLNRIKQKIYPDEGVVGFGYDPAGNLTLRNMPGGLSWRATYDQAGRIDFEYLQQNGAATSRYFDYSYYPAGGATGAWVGLLAGIDEKVSEGAIATRHHEYSYDANRRVSIKASTGTEDHAVTVTKDYDFPGRVKTATRTCAGTTTNIESKYDGYGQLYQETVRVGGTVHSQLDQRWDALGFRTGLGTGSAAAPLAGAPYLPDFEFSYYGNGSVKGVSTHNGRYRTAYTYADNRLITSADLLDGDQSVMKVLTPLAGSYDSRGRLMARTSNAAGGQLISESVVRNGDSRISSYTLSRGTGPGGAWGHASETRSYSYDDRGKLLTESYLTNPDAPAAGHVSETLTYGFDPAKLGFLASVSKSGGQVLWTAPVGGFARPIAQTANPALRSFQVNGTAHGPGQFALYVAPGASPAEEDFAKVAEFFPASRATSSLFQPNADWSYPLSLAPGNYTLQARARMVDYPARPFEAKSDPVSITVDGSQPIGYTVAYDASGQMTSRSWENGQVVQTLEWSADDRLESVTLTDSRAAGGVGYTWSALYDPSGRRIRTTYHPDGSTVPSVVKSTYDPEFEFLEIAVESAGRRQWKLHGPDLMGAYGSAQGIGGCEAVIDELTGALSPVLDDFLGNIVGYVDTAGTAATGDDQVIWNEVQMSGYGVLPGFAVAGIEHTGDLPASMNWHGRRIDPTGFYFMGARHYDPESRRFLSADPAGHASSMDLYSYANGDPVNHIDPDGRFARTVGAGISSMFEFLGVSSQGYSRYASPSFSVVEPSFGTVSAGGWNAKPVESMLSMGVNMIPVIGTAKSFIELSSGSDLFTGAPVSQVQGTFNVLASAVPFGAGAAGKWASTATSSSLSVGISGAGRSFAGTAANSWGVAAKTGVRDRVLANIAASHQARAGSGFAQASRRWTALDAYEGAGWPAARIESHLQGIDFSKPVTMTTIPAGTPLVQYQIPGAPIGNYFAPVGTPGNTLGFYIGRRVPTVHSFSHDVRALRSTAADITDTWSVPGRSINAPGGGTQFFVP